MHVSGIDHVNILTDRLESSARFYERLLGLTRTDNPAVAGKGAWMRDAHGNAIVHLVWKEAPQAGDEPQPIPGTNTVHHVAFKCHGFDETVRNLEEMGLAYRVKELRHLGLRQIFVADPNSVNLEFNFTTD